MSSSTPLLMRDQLAAGMPLSGSPAGMAAARFHSRLLSPWSAWLKPPVPICDPGGPSSNWVVAASGVSFRSPHSSTLR